MSKTKDSKNLRLAGLFVVLVLGLILLSALFKGILLIETSRFDGSHNFIVNFKGEGGSKIVTFSPQNSSFSVLTLDAKYAKDDLGKLLEIPLDGTITDYNGDNISSTLLHSVTSFGKPLKNLTILDAFRLFLFAKTVSVNKMYERQFSASLSDQQKSTILSLSFTDPSIYQENQSIQVVNGANIFGVGSRLATLITNLGGSVVLVSTSDSEIKDSKIVYYGEKSYTVKRLSEYLGLPVEQSLKRGVADVIITIGTDRANKLNF